MNPPTPDYFFLGETGNLSAIYSSLSMRCTRSAAALRTRRIRGEPRSGLTATRSAPRRAALRSGPSGHLGRLDADLPALRHGLPGVEAEVPELRDQDPRRQPKGEEARGGSRGSSHIATEGGRINHQWLHVRAVLKCRPSLVDRELSDCQKLRNASKLWPCGRFICVSKSLFKLLLQFHFPPVCGPCTLFFLMILGIN